MSNIQNFNFAYNPNQPYKAHQSLPNINTPTSNQGLLTPENYRQMPALPESADVTDDAFLNSTQYGLMDIPFRGLETTHSESTGINKTYQLPGEKRTYTDLFTGEDVTYETSGDSVNVNTITDNTQSAIMGQNYKDEESIGVKDEEKKGPETPVDPMTPDWEGITGVLGKGLMQIAQNYYNEGDTYGYFNSRDNKNWHNLY